jgi:hemolysin activation/secretion protein
MGTEWHARGSRAAWWLAGLWVTGLAQAQGTTPPGAPPPEARPPVRTPDVVPRSEDLAPRTEPARSDVRLPAVTAPRELSKPEGDFTLDVKAFQVDDQAPPELKAALARITAAYTGPQRRFEDLANAASEVTRFLQRDLGYYLGYAYLPAQTPEGGVVRIGVLEGRLDRVVLNWDNKLPVRREVVEAYLGRLRPGAVLKVRDVERVVFLVNDLRGLTARFEVRAGALPGTATLVVTPRPEAAWSARAEVDANGSEALGRFRVAALGQLNSPFGQGDGFTANVLTSHTGGMRFGLLGYTTPVGSDGFKLGTSVSGVAYQLDKDTFPLDLNGGAATFNGYGLYPLVRSRNLNLFTLASLEQKRYVDRQQAAETETRKRVTTLALGSTGDFRDSLLGGGVNTFDLNVVGGEVKYPAGRPGGLDDAPSFTKLTYGFTRLQDLVTGRALVYLALRGQHSLKNLDTTEQYRLGGPDAVRAFATGEGTGDRGTVLTTELRLLPPESWFGRTAREMVFSVFVDAGYVQYRVQPRINATAQAEANHAQFSGWGTGLAWVRPGSFSLRMSVAKAMNGQARSEADSPSARLFVQAAVPFN